MATVRVNADLLNEVLSDRIQRHGVVLSDFARGLLRLLAEAWFADLPPLKGYDNPAEAAVLAERIIELASHERHVLAQLQQQRPVDLFTWMYALSESGAVVLRELWNKGF